MDKVRIDKGDLLKKIKENREAHRKDYDEAVVGFKATAVDMMELYLRKAKEGGEITLHIDLRRPVNKLAEYDRAIAMLMLSVDAVIELTVYEFDCYVLDNWNWKLEATLANGAYKSAR